MIRASLHGGGKGSSQTRESHEFTFSAFVNWAYANNWQLTGPESIKTKHLEAFVKDRLAQGISKRTLQKDMAALRRSLIGVGRAEFARQVTNKHLGLQARRLGFHSPLPKEKYEEARTKMNQKEPGAASVLEIGLTCGFRREEGVRSKSEILANFIADLEKGNILHVPGGITKGGKARNVTLQPEQVPPALAALKRAHKIAEENGGYLIKALDREKAVKKYANIASRYGGLTGEESTHSARCSFAHANYHALRAAGLSKQQALIALSLNLGHGGSGSRGRYCKMVYLRGVVD